MRTVMAILVHHKPADKTGVWNMRVWQAAWDGNNVWDTTGTSTRDTVDFQLPDVRDARKLQFKYYSGSSTGDSWESDDFGRRLFLVSVSEVWTFQSSPRILYENPNPVGVAFRAGDVLTFHVITHSAFEGGKLYVWDAYDPSLQPAYFAESARDGDVSIFNVMLRPRMTSGFNLKLMKPSS